MAELTPMMKQYFEMKKKHPESILFFRLGDFYEMFHQDAILVSRELELTLTTRDRNKPIDQQTPMCGMPYHSSEGYIARLIAKGYKIAICEQTQDPATAKGLVERDVVRVVTPGTVTESSMLKEGENNYLAVVYAPTSKELSEKEGGLALVFCDVSTGRLYGKNLAFTHEITSELCNEIGRFSPREVILSTGALELKWLTNFLKDGLQVSFEEGDGFLEHQGRKVCQEQFSADDVPESPELLCGLGGLFHYLVNTLKTELSYLSNITYLDSDEFLKLDILAHRNLELTKTLWNREKKGTLLWVMDKTKTAMGGRLIQEWVKRPLYNVSEINNRQNAVEELLANPLLESQLRDDLKEIPDLERAMGRVSYGTASGKELRALALGLEVISNIKSSLQSVSSSKLQELEKNLIDMTSLSKLLLKAIVEDPPTSIREGGIIADGYHEEVDRLRHIIAHGGELMAELEEKTKEETGIRNLKVRYNKVFGYFIEVSKAQANAVPEHWVRKQTTTNNERFISQELKEMEETVLNAKEKIHILEYEIYQQLREETCKYTQEIQTTAQALAEIDVLRSFVQIASDNNYVAPEVNQSTQLEIEDGRHPVVELLAKDGLFVPNNTEFNDTDKICAIITGPNMAGKSTYMRQVALLVIMAQMGSYIPVKSAKIGLVDKIFTRIGASDDLVGGKSTFMVEMSEVAQLLKQATRRSLLILDEVGRGTSTYDGMAMAKAVLEYCRETIGAKTLFATHYHELSVVEEELTGVVNYNIAAKQKGDTILFLRKIIPGGADQSYGIQVAKLAGVPDFVIERAYQILAELEAGSQEQTGKKVVPQRVPVPVLLTAEEQEEQKILEELKAIDLDDLSPRAALERLTQWKEQLK